jgi:hypothetical protein
MVVSSDPLQLAVASDGSLAALHEAGRISLLELPSGAVFAEIAVDPDAAASEIAWVGTPPRLLVLSRYAAHSSVHMLDPTGPRSISEIRLELPMRLAASVGNWALVIGQLGAAVLSTSDSHVFVYPFSTRSVPFAAGAAGNQFVVGLASTIEEWDPQSRLPKRRLRLPRAAAITAVGGSERLVWMTTAQEPARIDVIPLVNRGQPRAHDLPEAIARIASHPRGDLVACIGAETGRLYVVDLDGRHRLRVVSPDEVVGGERFDALGMLIGRAAGVLVVQAGRQAAIVPHGNRDASEPVVPAPAPILPRSDPALRLPRSDPSLRLPAADGVPHEAVDAARAGTSLGDPEPTPPPMPPVAPPPVAPARPTATPPAGVPVAASARAIASASERFSAWRDQARHNQRPAPIAASPPPGQAGLPPAHGDPRLSWRDEVVAWSRAVTAGAIEHNPPPAPRIDAVLARFALALHLQPVLVLLYGAHLCGECGAAPIDVARVLDRQWDEALGKGELAQHGVATYAGSRVALAPALLRVLDELPPLLGPVVGEPGDASPLLGPCVVVAPAGEALLAVAERCLTGAATAILVAHGAPELADLLFEARAHGAVPLVRCADPLAAPPREPMIFVVADDEAADALALPRLA